MRIVVACIGRGKNAPEQELCEAYLKRARTMGRKLGFGEIALKAADVSRAARTDARLDEEATRLLRFVPAGAHRIALDERGRALASADFAKRLRDLRDAGTRDLVFLIGGPDGLQPTLCRAADERLAFGPQTWPHLLARAMLTEQIYRALAILAGHPYHRGGRR